MMAEIKATSTGALTTAALASCPCCDYAFEGLGASGQCPECGFAYDERTLLHRRSVWRSLRTYAFLVVGAALLGWVILQFRAPLEAMLAPWDIVVMLAILTFWIGAIVLLALGAMHTQYHVHWCVGPRVLVVRPFLQGRKQIRLDDKKGFMVYSGVSLQRGSVIVRRKKGLPFVISSGIGASDMDLHRFIDEVNARMRAIQIDAMEREP